MLSMFIVVDPQVNTFAIKRDRENDSVILPVVSIAAKPLLNNNDNDNNNNDTAGKKTDANY